MNFTNKRNTNIVESLFIASKELGRKNKSFKTNCFKTSLKSAFSLVSFNSKYNSLFQLIKLLMDITSAFSKGMPEPIIKKVIKLNVLEINELLFLRIHLYDILFAFTY